LSNSILGTDLRGHVLSERKLNVPVQQAGLTILTQTIFKMNIKPIRNEANYKDALERLGVTFDSKKGTDGGDELGIIAKIQALFKGFLMFKIIFWITMKTK